MSRRVRIGAIVVVCLGIAGSAYAHKPISIGEPHASVDRAVVLEDIDVSQVVYAPLSGEQPQVWLAFETLGPETLALSLGVPVIERLSGYRPWVAVLGPGLPEVDLPIEVPEGVGGVAFRGREPADAPRFFEPFTGTESWITVEETVAIPSSGVYHVVAWAPESEADKLWVAIGFREQFGLRDVLSLPAVVRDVRAFHEVPPRRVGVRWESVLVLAVAVVAIARAVLR